jgi:ribonucleoside-diphosphate reductase alpha chain
LEIPYGSNESISLASKVMEFVFYHSRRASIELARLRGSFPNFNSSVFADETKLREIFKYPKSRLDWKSFLEQIKTSGIRNATTTTIAPTGTIGIIANASGGIEPLFAVAFRREGVLATAGSQAKTLFEVNPVFEKLAREREFYSPELLEKISRKSSIQEIDDIPKDIRDIFVTAHDISPEGHIKIQSAFQKFTDNAVSKTINFPNAATQEDIERAFLSAWKSGCKGITVYRDGSRKLQVLTTERKKEEPESKPVPDVLFGLTLKLKTGCGNSFILLSLDGKGIPRRIFNNMGKAGLCPGAHTQALCRIMSHYFARGGDVDTAIEQLDGIACHRPFGIGPAKILSCADAVAKALKWYRQFKKADETYDFPRAVALISENPELKWWEIGEEQKSTSLDMFLSDSKLTAHSSKPIANSYGACRVCGGPVIEQEGCRKCSLCGSGDCF